MDAASDEREEDPAEACRFGWNDGSHGHICRQDGPHEGHKCCYCSAVYDPEVRLERGRYGGLVAIRD